jgi:hypothetical protein
MFKRTYTNYEKSCGGGKCMAECPGIIKIQRLIGSLPPRKPVSN